MSMWFNAFNASLDDEDGDDVMAGMGSDEEDEDEEGDDDTDEDEDGI